jgi:hypothetical protein
MKTEEIITLFEKEFEPVLKKFVVLKLLDKTGSLDIKRIEYLKLPSPESNLVWHPGVYIFFGNGKPYRVGRHLDNSRMRVMQHLKAETGNNLANVWDIENAPDREVLLFNVINREDYHWVAAVEIYMERILKGYDLQIPAKRQG